MVLTNWTATCKIMKLDHFLTPCTKTNPRCIKDLNIRPEIVKLLKENIGCKLLHIGGLGNNFLNLIPKAKATKSKINSGITSNLKAAA